MDRDPLKRYRAMRDPERTPEPFGGDGQARGNLFVIQKHRARSLHYDLRLEMDGVLKSWAVPKGPSVRHTEKRLAVQVEDHPLEYADFEGVIPQGNYGAGSVIVWDRGFYRSVKDEDPLTQLSRGKLELEFNGFKLRGTWVLARMSGKEKEWLLIAKGGAAEGKEEMTDQAPESVFSGMTVEELGDGSRRLGFLKARLEALGAPEGDVPVKRQKFMLASLLDKPFSNKTWLFEIKYDGVRIFASREGESVELFGRSGSNVTLRYPEVVRALKALPSEHFLMDGEIVAMDLEGRPSFQLLQARMHLTNPLDIEQARASNPVRGIFFDCLASEGRDLRLLPLKQRREGLELLLPKRGVIQHTESILEHGTLFYEAASEQGLEGIVAKRLEGRYRGGRSREWLKMKCQLRQEFVIGGYTLPQGSRAAFGALHLGRYEKGKLVYVSKVGTGFSDETLQAIRQQLTPLERAAPPFAAGAPQGLGHVWVKPDLVCEVRFTAWTRDGGIRHPTFLGLREDKAPRECIREDVVKLEVRVPQGRVEERRPRVKVTNPDKLFWPREGYRKADLVVYYDGVGPYLLPYLRERPLVLTRYPDGIHGKSFFQKDAPDFVPDWIRTERIYSKDAEREINYFIANDIDTLRYVVNLGTIPLHIWSCRLGSLDRPDWLVLDLDPKEAPFADVVKVARRLHRILEELEIVSFPKTSGATGLHILIPLGRRYSHEEGRTFARLVALLGVQAEPELATVARPIRNREGKVYIDFGQNGHGRTIVAPFSVRPLSGAPVSWPLHWSEVTGRLDPARFHIRRVPKLLEKFTDPMAAVLKESIDIATAISRIEERLLRQKRKESRR